MANFCTVISQNQPTNTLNITGCANSSSFRDVALILTFWYSSLTTGPWFIFPQQTHGVMVGYIPQYLRQMHVVPKKCRV